MNSNNNGAKFAFFYLLSLVALIFMALSTGMIVFQIINKNLVDIINQYQGRFSDDALKFAISALIISTPLYYLTASQIMKNLKSGALDRDSGIRKWLTYLILLITSVVALGWLIGVINTFLDGDLTNKFILKAITAIFIAAATFTFYFYDIKRDKVNKPDNVIKAYLYGSLIIIIAVFVASLFTVESPTQTRNRKIDEAILNSFSQVNNEMDMYFEDYGKLPASLEVLSDEYRFLKSQDLVDPATRKIYEYKIVDEKTFELCANFRTSNLDDEEESYKYMMDTSRHDIGYQCLKNKIRNEDNEKMPMRVTQ